MNNHSAPFTSGLGRTSVSSTLVKDAPKKFVRLKIKRVIP